MDQVLLSVLPVKHQALRHFGLSSKILMLDEVDEMGEPYIGRELERLLQIHRAVGGSAILLIMTLHIEMRSHLLSTYGGANHNLAYPALTVTVGEVRTDFAADHPAMKGPVLGERLDQAEKAVDLLVERAGRGLCLGT